MTTTRRTKKKPGRQGKSGELSAEELDGVTGGTNAQLATQPTTTTSNLEMNSWLEAAQAGMMNQAVPKKRKPQ